jgi:putative DNA primase/helicase
MTTDGWYYRDPLEHRVRTADDERKAADNARKIPIIWNARRPPGGTRVDAYLRRGRRWQPDIVLYPDSGDGCPETLGYSDDLTLSPKPPVYRGLVAAVNDARTGLVVALQRIPLDAAGQPLLRPDGKKHKWSLGPIVGNAFRGSCLPDPQGRWAICEGIENALSATQLLRYPCWSSVTAGNMPHVQPPNWARHALIIADNDENEVGIDAASRTLIKLRAVPWLESVRVVMADAPGADIIDVLRESPYHA